MTTRHPREGARIVPRQVVPRRSWPGPHGKFPGHPNAPRQAPVTVHVEHFALVDERTAREAGDEAVRSALEGEVGAVAAATQRAAVGGPLPQVVGWFLVLLGIVVGGAANVLKALTS